MNRIKVKSKYKFYTVSKENWKDFEKLFGEKGACAGCWCMYWRISSSQWKKQQGAGNKRAIKRLIFSGKTPGLLAYDNGQPIGWCSVTPRAELIRLESSRIFKPVDDKPVWSIVCFFIDKNYRKKGVSVEFLNAAKKYVKSKRGKIIEGYPVEPKEGKYPDTFAYTGLVTAFTQTGFKEVTRRSETRPIMRFYLK